MTNTIIAMPDHATLMRMATGYLARYSASSQRLRRILGRRISRWCAVREFDPPDAIAIEAALDDVIAHLEHLQLLDDQAFAEGRVRALQRKGLPERRIRMALQAEGLQQTEADGPDTSVDDHAQAHRFAARKRLGPYRRGERAPFRDKDLRSLLRAGFSHSVAVAAVDADRDDA